MPALSKIILFFMEFVFEENLEKGWKERLFLEFEKDYFKELKEKLSKERGEKNIFPTPENIFKAFSLCPFSKTKVVILGQDPYHKKGQAHGLAFSVPEGVKIPPSLRNIYKEIQADLGEVKNNLGNLEVWAKQGVLLLNASLSVEEGKAGSHQKLGWENFTNEVISVISREKEKVVFLLWGNFAKEKEKYILNKENHLILKTVHPSPLSAYNGFFGCRHFSQTNNFLKESQQEEIIW